MARRSAPPIASPNYGDLKPQVIEFLRAILMGEHKPDGPIRVVTRDGERRLFMQCMRCKVHLTAPSEGEIVMTHCAPLAGLEGLASMTFGSLFSGIGGIDLGLERSGFICRFQIESDPFCRTILAAHWPAVPRYDDIREVDAHDLPPVDLLAGGFPCQDLSQAGRRRGITGSRSGLWAEFANIIGVLRPRYILVENVPGLLARGMGRVCGDLAQAGYDTEWTTLSAAAFGAPHIRERVYLVAYPSGIRRHASAIFTGAAQTARRAATSQGIWGVRVDRTNRGGIRRLPDCGLCRVVDGVPDQLDRYRVLGNAAVPAIVQWLGECIVQHARGVGDEAWQRQPPLAAPTTHHKRS